VPSPPPNDAALLAGPDDAVEYWPTMMPALPVRPDDNAKPGSTDEIPEFAGV
jgi:hypothetical protein